jgi:predicted NUDIX family phosphoesterase
MSYDNLSSVSQNILKFYGTAKVKIAKKERDPSLFTSKQLINFKILRNTTQVIVRHRICLQTDGHCETRIPLYNFVAGV